MDTKLGAKAFLFVDAVAVFVVLKAGNIMHMYESYITIENLKFLLKKVKLRRPAIWFPTPK